MREKKTFPAPIKWSSSLLFFRTHIDLRTPVSSGGIQNNKKPSTLRQLQNSKNQKIINELKLEDSPMESKGDQPSFTVKSLAS